MDKYVCDRFISINYAKEISLKRISFQLQQNMIKRLINLCEY